MIKAGFNISAVAPSLLRSLFAATVSVALFCEMLHAQSIGSYVSTKRVPGAVTLSAEGRSAPLIIHRDDAAGVRRVAALLQSDIGSVTGRRHQVYTDTVPAADEIVLIGTLGHAPLIDALAAKNMIDAHEIRGRWESFLIQTVDHPFPHVRRALVIAGSDKRGTIYGMLDLSRKIGVSPWTWWADVPVKKQKALFVRPGRFIDRGPSVQYRGIFINDEAPALSGWATEKFGGFNHAMYEHVFELMLRLRLNYLWPAMWGRSFFEEDTMNARLADEYGIVIGTSHHEPFLRAQADWQKHGVGPWNYEKNDSVLRRFWRDGIRRMGKKESIVTIGMRGDGDEPMSDSANIAVLERIVRDQRTIIAEETGRPAEQQPQLWALYKEVQEYYDRGMRVPDDVTPLLCDDNWGNIRKLPHPTDGPRAGGYGIYYHYDYVGGPRNYKWTNTVQIERVWEQFRLAYVSGAKKLWIVNVGDIKPMEFPISFFSDYSWRPEAVTAADLPGYYRSWASEQFGPDHAKEIGVVLAAVTKFNARRKPELLDSTTYSIVNEREADRVWEEWRSLRVRAEKIAASIPAEQRDAFYQLVLHPVTAAAVVNQMHIAAGKNHLYAKQGRASAALWAKEVRRLFTEDSMISLYYNGTLAGGKWNHMMDQTHIGYTTWQQPEVNVMPPVTEPAVPAVSRMGVTVDGTERAAFRTGDTLELPVIGAFDRSPRSIEIFNAGSVPFRYALRSAVPWIFFSASSGTVTSDRRIELQLDWKKVPPGKHRVPITVSGADSAVTVIATVDKLESMSLSERGTFRMDDGVIAIEADHFARSVGAWSVVQNLGRTGSSVVTADPLASEPSPGKGTPHLEYSVEVPETGMVSVTAFFSPSHNVFGGELRYAVSLDDDAPVVSTIIGPAPVKDWTYPAEWSRAVAENIRMVSTQHHITRSGVHRLKYWLVDPGVVLQRVMIANGRIPQTYLGPQERTNTMNQ